MMNNVNEYAGNAQSCDGTIAHESKQITHAISKIIHDYK